MITAKRFGPVTRIPRFAEVLFTSQRRGAYNRSVNPMLTRPRSALEGSAAPAASGPGAPADLVIVANGPGELSNWAVPMARAAREWAASKDLSLTLSLVLPPCQVASGQEAAYAGRRAVFDRIFGPRECVGFVLGLRRFPASGPGCVLHMGGDLWYSATLARRFRFSAFAYVETTLIRRRARRFQGVFVPSGALADRLVAGKVSRERLHVVGDLRAENVARVLLTAPRPRGGARVALLPGSRRWITDQFLPYLLDIAARMRAARPDLQFALVTSPFLSRRDITRALGASRESLGALGVEVVDEDHHREMAACDLAITLPGTNTVELAILGVPMLIILPLQRPGVIRTPGLNEWLSRIPGMATLVKSVVIAWYLRHHPFLSWPNQEAGRLVVPEMVGRLYPPQVARQAVEMLDDRPALAAMARDLRTLYTIPEGAARAIMDGMAPFLRPAPVQRST